jgi:ABC-2 type transport system ATP-binding protein
MTTTRSPATPGGIEARGLVKSFGSVRAVRDLDLSIAPGETVALLGPNGAGKSTTIDMILGLARPDGGTVTVFGRPPDRAVAAGAVGAMLQTGSLLRDLDVRELLAMMASLYPDPLDIGEVMELTGTAAIAGRRTQKLSGGETQRVRFALALVANPRLLVLDEPTVALDVEGRNAFWAAMRDFAAGGRTVLFATHHLDEADRFADRVVLMARGRIVADGPANEIKALAGSRTIRATVPRPERPGGAAAVSGTTGVERPGGAAAVSGTTGVERPGGAAALSGTTGIAHAELADLPGVTRAERRGDAVVLACHDSDRALRALLAAHPEASAIEVTGAGLEEAFLDLTADVDGADDEPLPALEASR